MEERPRNWRDRAHKHILSQNLDLFLRAFDPARARQLRLDTIIDRSADIFDDLPAWYGRIADVVAQIEALDGNPRLLLAHVEIQRMNAEDFGWRMLDYYMLLRRKTGLPVLPYALLLHPATPAIGRAVYRERLLGQTVVQLAYRQISLPALDGLRYVRANNPLAVAYASAMHLPDDETSRVRVFGLALRRIAEAVYRGALSRERAVPLWGLVRAQLPYPIEARADAGVQWTQEVNAVAEAIERTWVDDLIDEAERRGEQRGEERGAAREQRVALRQVLRHRFGGITPEIEARIDSLHDAAHVRGMLDRALDATSLDDVFADI